MNETAARLAQGSSRPDFPNPNSSYNPNLPPGPHNNPNHPRSGGSGNPSHPGHPQHPHNPNVPNLTHPHSQTPFNSQPNQLKIPRRNFDKIKIQMSDAIHIIEDSNVVNSEFLNRHYYGKEHLF